MKRSRCPYCFTEFRHDEEFGDVEFQCRSCGNDFTLGEANRGRPDAVKPNDLAALIARVAELEATVAQLAARMLSA